MTDGPTTDDINRFTSDQVNSLALVLGLIRSGEYVTRSSLARRAGLGRTVISERLAQLGELELMASAGLDASTGGRAPERLRFRSETGVVLVGMLGATSLSVGLADLAGNLRVSIEQPTDVAAGPETVLRELEVAFDALIKDHHVRQAAIWGTGISLPGPVEFATGRPCAPPIMPGWDNYPVRGRLEQRYGASAWVDNEVNALALGELRGGLGRSELDMIYVKAGTGIGAGLVSAGHLHRGANGCAGDIGHTAAIEDSSFTCRCGNTGCLETLAGGAALARDGTALALEGQSPLLAKILAENGAITAKDVAFAASHGDTAAMSQITTAGKLIGETLATLVSFFNPSLVILGGGLAGAGDNLLATIRHTVYRRSLPLATRDLRIVRTILGDRAGLIGAAFMVTDELFSVKGLRQWVEAGSPAGMQIRTSPHTTVTTLGGVRSAV